MADQSEFDHLSHLTDILLAHQPIISGDGEGWWTVCGCGFKALGTHRTRHVAEQVERVVAARQADALAVVKRACDIECKSPGKHTQCSSHEPYRALHDAIYPPASTTAEEA